MKTVIGGSGLVDDGPVMGGGHGLGPGQQLGGVFDKIAVGSDDLVVRIEKSFLYLPVFPDGALYRRTDIVPGKAIDLGSLSRLIQVVFVGVGGSLPDMLLVMDPARVRPFARIEPIVIGIAGVFHVIDERPGGIEGFEVGKIHVIVTV